MGIHFLKDNLCGNYFSRYLSIKVHEKSLPLKIPEWGNSGTVVAYCGQQFITGTLCGKDGSFLPMVGSLHYRTLMNCMYWFPVPIKLPVDI